MTCRRDTLMIRIAVSRDCNLIDAVTDLETSRFISYYLFIKKTLSSVLSVFCLDMWNIVSNVETLKLMFIYDDVIISVDAVIILNAIRSWSVGFNDSVNWVKKLKMSFVARFDVDDDVITVNEAEFDDDDDAVAVDKAILMFWHNELTWFNSSAFITFVIDISALLSLTVFFNLETDCELRCMILLLNWSNLLSSV